MQFHEYFHGDTGAGIGATHQTGWTGCVAAIMKTSAIFTSGTAAETWSGGGGLSDVDTEKRHEGTERMKSYYQDNKLPEPMVPAVQALTLLKGQTAIVTGGNSGIGKAIAISLGKAGANVVVNYVVKPEEAEAVAAEIRKQWTARHDCAGGRVRRSASAGDVCRRRARVRHCRHSREQRGHGAQRAVPRDDRRAMGRAS